MSATVTPLTIENAQAALEHWQRVLGLRDWTVTVAIHRAHELGELTCGDCRAAEWKRDASIRLLDERDVGAQGFQSPDRAGDWEYTLVHELLHLQFCHYDLGLRIGSNHQWRALERAIDKTAWALVGLQREP